MKQKPSAMVNNVTERRDKFGILLMIASSLCVCVGQLLWKLSVDGNPLYLFPGFFLYGAGFLAMITAYKYGSLSKLQPINSLNYVFAVLLGYSVLDESITVRKIAGIAIIAVSVVIIGSSAE